MIHVGDTMSTSGDVQYIGGWKYSPLSADIWNIFTLYDVCSVHRGGVQYIGGCSVHRGDTMSTSGDTMSTSGGYHEYIGGIP